MTKEEIKNKLIELGIEVDDKLKKDELAQLLEEEMELQEREFVVIRDFKDLNDSGKIYIKDDIYRSSDEERIQELMSGNNKIGKPLIKEQA